MKKCYICLPIAGMEDTVLERIEKASKRIKELGMYPVSPIDINEITENTLANKNRPVGKFMGNDIETLIDYCDAIYFCRGWEESKGCNVEWTCADQYGKEMFYEEYDEYASFSIIIENRYRELVQEYRAINEKCGPGSESVNTAKNMIKKYKNFFKDWFNYEVGKDF